MASFNTHAFAAGPYNAVYGGVTPGLGVMVGAQQAPSLEITPHGQAITNTHVYGRTTIGVIGQGAEAFFNGILMEYTANSLAALWPFGGTNITNGTIPPLGVDWYGVSATLILTAQAATLAATNGPVTVTCAKAYIAPEFMVKYMFGPELREMPVRMQLFPESVALYRFWLNT